jgi:alpha-L-fucosidase
MLPYPAWNALPAKDLRSGGATAAQGNPDGDAWAPLEADTTLYKHNWFWAADNEKRRKSLQELMDIYYKSAGRGGVLLLNSTPNTNGLIPEGDLKLYAAFGREIGRRFGRPIAETNSLRGTTAHLVLPQPALINHVIIMEDYREGERIREYVIEGMSNGQWKELRGGLSIGRKKIDLFPPAQLSQVRLRVTQASGTPLLRSLAAYYVEGVSTGTLTNLTAGTPAWQQCGSWTAQSFRGNQATLTLELSPFITTPGQYEVRFDQTGGKNAFRIAKSTLLYEGEEATPGLLTRLADANTFNVNRTAQVTTETSSRLKVDITAEGGPDCEGRVRIRPRPAE